MKEYAEKYPELREAYLSKVRMRKDFTSGEMTTKDNTSKCLDDLELVLDEVETQLQKMRSGKIQILPNLRISVESTVDLSPFYLYLYYNSCYLLLGSFLVTS